MSTATPPVAVDSIIAQLQETGLIPPDQLAPFIPPAATPTDAVTLTNQLVERGLLTKFQASQVATGKVKSLVIGAYAMLDRVTGGGGLLFKAVHRRMQRVVLIKPLPPSLMKTAAPRVQRDVAAAGRITHPHLVGVQDLDEVGGAFFLVSEFVDGADLATVAQQGKFAIDKACGLVAQAAEGLAFLHAQGIPHRDVKIENLFIERNGAVKLFGLGISPSETGDSAGDVLGLGRVLYRLVAGSELPPAATPSLKASRPEVSPALERFCLRMFSATPSERPSAAEIAAALRSPELTAPVPVVDPNAPLFPELFVGAEEEAATVMSAPFDPGALPPLNSPAAPVAAPQQPAAAPAPVEISTPAAFAPAPAATAPAPYAPPPYAAPPFAPAPAAPAPFAPIGASPNVPGSPNLPPSPMPTPFSPAAMTSPEMTPSGAPTTPASAPVGGFGISEFGISTAPSPAATSVPEMVVAAVGDDDDGLAVATLDMAAADPFAATSSFDATTTTTTPSAAKSPAKRKNTKPIELPLGLKLDPKFLEPKYVAGAAGGALVLIGLLIWALVGSTKPAPVRAVPAAPVVKGPKPLAPADITPGLFALPPSNLPTPTRNAAGNSPKAKFDAFGFQVPDAPAPTATPKKKK